MKVEEKIRAVRTVPFYRVRDGGRFVWRNNKYMRIKTFFKSDHGMAVNLKTGRVIEFKWFANVRPETPTKTRFVSQSGGTEPLPRRRKRK